MSYSCKILLDSISPTGKRLTTFEITFPRIVLAEFNTHRMFSRNSASSRAIPFIKQLDRVQNDPFIPEQFPVNTKGMQPQTYVTQGPLFSYAKNAWKMALEDAIKSATRLQKSISNIVINKEDLTIHKQLVNRLLEPFMWHTVIVTATEFDNFFKLRCDENVQYEIRRIADLMYEAYHAPDNSLHSRTVAANYKPFNDRSYIATQKQHLKIGEWHCPLVYEEDEALIQSYLGENIDTNIIDEETQNLKKKISVARCARISYLTHDGKRDIEKDLDMYSNKLMAGDPKHSSPAEHIATPYHRKITQFQFEQYKIILNDPTHKLHLETKEALQVRANNGEYFLLPRIGNFYGWLQHRKEFADENCTNFRKEN